MRYSSRDDVVDRMAVRACIAAEFDKREFSVGWPQNVVLVQVDLRVKLVESHIS